MNADPNAAAMRLTRALSDPARLRIATLLLDAALTPEQIAATLNLSLPEVLRHLKLLSDSGLLILIARGDARHFSLDQLELQHIRRAALATERAADPVLESDPSDQKVLRDFVKDGRLTSIPASHKKKLVILRWLATQVPYDVRLPEREVNTLLQRYHPDFATLRRELVDNGFLARDRGVYWRLGEQPST